MILTIEGLRKAFGGIKAVDDVSIDISEGEVSSVIGPNGAGKTTLFHLLTGHLRPDSGKVIFRGEDITGLPPHTICRKRIGRSFQRTITFPRLSVFENIQTAILGGRGRSFSFFRPASNMVRTEVEEIIDAVGLAPYANMLASELAHGDQRRLEIGIALSNEPYLVLLDEPTAGMSFEEGQAIMVLIQRLAREQGLTMIFVEHDMRVVFDYSEKVRVMHQGRIIAEGEPKEIRGNSEVQRIYLGEEAI